MSKDSIKTSQMKEFRVVWQQCPHIHHDSHVLFVEAANAEDASQIARNHVERSFGVEWFTIHKVEEATPPPPGQVIK